MVKVRMNTADVAAEVKCLRRLICMRCSNVYDLSSKTYVFKLVNSSGTTESEESEKVLLLMESGIRLHTTAYLRDKSNTPSGFTLKLRKHIRTKRLEDVRQLGYDRIVLFQFGAGAHAHYVILELYSQGNLILTDSEFLVMTLLRSHRGDEKGVAIMSRHRYPVENCRVFERTGNEKIKAALTRPVEPESEEGENATEASQVKEAGGKSVKSKDSKQSKAAANGGARAKQPTLKIRVTFVDEFGVEEAGIDGGCIFKDFMENVTQAAFDTQYGLFKETTDHLLYPNPGSGMVHEMHLQYFHFLGTVLAKAMFEGILVDIPFATFFLSKLKQKHNYLNDLPSLDPELYRHLLFLNHYKGDLSRLELYFTIVNNEYGEQIEDELVTEGKEIRVTSENVIRFIHLVANYRLNFQICEQSTHFLKGFQQFIKKEWIDMFNAHELQLLISGSVDGLDIDDLRANAQYTGGYHPEHYNIEMFWEVIKCLSVENQRKFLKFVTGCSRGPLLGFKRLEPMFCIQRVAGAASEETLNRLPTAATCLNLLKLPPYRSKEQMELKLLYAINSAAGFDLS